jgi:hypothetical protein
MACKFTAPHSSVFLASRLLVGDMAEPPYRDDCCGDVPTPVARTCNAAISTKAARFAGGHLPLRIISPKPSTASLLIALRCNAAHARAWCCVPSFVLKDLPKTAPDKRGGMDDEIPF